MPKKMYWSGAKSVSLARAKWTPLTQMESRIPDVPMDIHESTKEN